MVASKEAMTAVDAMARRYGGMLGIMGDFGRTQMDVGGIAVSVIVIAVSVIAVTVIVHVAMPKGVVVT